MKQLVRMRFLLLTLTALLLGSCYPEGPEYTEDLDVVYTTYDKDYDFAAGSTYAMPDKIVVDVEKDDNGDWQPEYMPDAFAGPILAQIQTNMTALGWTRLPNTPVTGEPNPDANIILTPAAMKSTNYFYSYWYDWWYYGWGGWYGWYYPPYYTISSYTTGSMIMVIADPHEESPINQTQAAWMSVGNGLFTGSYDIDRVKRSIDQAFAQSPYLKTN